MSQAPLWNSEHTKTLHTKTLSLHHAQDSSRLLIHSFILNLEP